MKDPWTAESCYRRNGDLILSRGDVAPNLVDVAEQARARDS